MDPFLYDKVLRQERVNYKRVEKTLTCESENWKALLISKKKNRKGKERKKKNLKL